jgi:hypothetical protein
MGRESSNCEGFAPGANPDRCEHCGARAEQHARGEKKQKEPASMTSEPQLYRQFVLHVLRNPWGVAEDTIRQVRLDAADIIEQLERELKIANLKNASSLANNLCPDHRDKQKGRPCLACEIERLERELADSRSGMDEANKRWIEAREVANRETLSAAYWKDKASSVSATENSDMAKDAARYRWLRSASVFDGTLKVDDGPDWWGDLGDALADNFDEMVDAAMAAADNRSADKGQG